MTADACRCCGEEYTSGTVDKHLGEVCVQCGHFLEHVGLFLAHSIEFGIKEPEGGETDRPNFPDK